MLAPSASNNISFSSIRAVFFDAVGTLIHVKPSAAEVYAEIGRRFGSRLDVAEIGRRFRQCFQIEDDIDVRAGLVTSEERERRRWHNIVMGVLDDVIDPPACFAALYEHFSRPDAWYCDPAAEAVLQALAGRGMQIGLASNYDHRLHAVAAGLPPLRFIEHLVISSEVGWRKPAPEFFAVVCWKAKLPREAILYVGDDLANDYQGATGYGLPSLLLDPAGRHAGLGAARLENLAGLANLLHNR